MCYCYSKLMSMIILSGIIILLLSLKNVSNGLKRKHLPCKYLVVIIICFFSSSVFSNNEYTGEIIFKGTVTNNRNPWTWKLMNITKDISLSVDKNTANNGDIIWKDLLSEQMILLGKTRMVTPFGHDGLAPRVSYGNSHSEISLTPGNDGIINVTLPFYDAKTAAIPKGTLSFKIRVAMLIRYVDSGIPEYAGVYNDLSGNGLPIKEWVFPVEKSSAFLCALFSEEAPAWLCAQNKSTRNSLPLSQLTHNTLRQIQVVYGAGIVAGSGVLSLQNTDIPKDWKTVLPVNIEYN
ncbi:Fimbrial, major and minor subunit [Citrobacter freundii]|nr:Fimbrial, major and minor subunit [Citrobacter freundii]